ncbi:PHD-finger [Sesbania bispinosa]|nr:PHD-finger [Sesbania bispinosa]
MERLEGSFSQILDLLKIVIHKKEIINDNSNNNENNGGGPSIKTNSENSPKVMIVTESCGPDEKVREEEARMMNKMEMLEEKMRALQGFSLQHLPILSCASHTTAVPPSVPLHLKSLRLPHHSNTAPPPHLFTPVDFEHEPRRAPLASTTRPRPP